ncbi:hypothetical protein EROM_071150 [Encephalitozoon romaleae SJ-2008]|uniref:Uncharacterized protein n=1 Tax=Encephalitozoon romaleae (strain SJ-2008) TaxID=1178016 RepID=I6ZUJ6_ENCRO|nr:hypothetical protein EROM_071150 [Encephalitozoon romaleae SJ-2008]AFN83366.1 hypothetical protein EROM_071150 [Encephalitozoon romaleae SJ-2008]
MRNQEEEKIEEKKEADVGPAKSGVIDGQKTSSARDPEPKQSVSSQEREENPKSYCINEFKEYITEIPFPIKEKTGIMKQFLSGVEKLFAIVKSSIRKAILWISRKNLRDEEKV